MKTILKVVLPLAIMMFIFSQCDTTSPDVSPIDIDNETDVLDVDEIFYAKDHSSDIKLKWKKVEGAHSYHLMISTKHDFKKNVIDIKTKDNSYIAESLSLKTNYYWKVYPIKKKKQNSGPWSKVKNFKIFPENSGSGNDSKSNSDGKNPSQPTPPPPSSGAFVSTHNANFVAGGKIFRFSGTNAYYLPNYEKLNPAVVDRSMNLFRDSGVSVVRMWGFYDGYDCGYSKNDSSENVIQTKPGVYNEKALRDLDRVIAKGKKRGIRFIIPFVNYWDELGGICQYNTWAGASNPSQNMKFFMNNSQTQKWYKDYIKMLLNRVNTVTGVRYKDEPAIFAWQIMNEGRNSGGNPLEMRNWYREIARYIKSIDPNHMVSTGEEGFDEGTPSEYSVGDYSNTYVLRAQLGTSYILNTAIPEIDFGSAHWYPNEWGFGYNINNSLLTAQRAWLSDHQKIASSVGKPFYIGEFGFPGWGDDRVVGMYDAFYKDVESLKIDGNLLWQLVADGTKCWEFGGNICYPGGRTDIKLYNKFKQHAGKMSKVK